MSRDTYLDDGFGNLWVTCGPMCQLEIVRPGKVQCSGGEWAPCQVQDRGSRKVYVRGMFGGWVLICPCCIWHTDPYPTQEKAFDDALLHIERFHAPGRPSWWHTS